MVLSIQHPPKPKAREVPSSANLLLSLLPECDRQRLISNSNLIFLPFQTTLYQPNEPIERVFFPIKGVIALINISEDGSIAETVSISNEGMVSIAAFLGGVSVSYFAITQTDCVAICLSANLLKQEFARGGKLQQILLLYTQALYTQVAQNVLCSCQHCIEQRLARWLLYYSDRLGKKELLLTQETLASLLGVRRSSLSVVANKLQQRNLIKYSRGRITVKNSVALKKIACNCNDAISAEYFRLLGS